MVSLPSYAGAQHRNPSLNCETNFTLYITEMRFCTAFEFKGSAQKTTEWFSSLAQMQETLV